MKTTHRKELTANRTAHSSLFENQDHSFTKEIYLDTVHYQDEDGSWKEMDNTFTEENPEESDSATQTAAGTAADENEYENKKGRWKVRLKKQSKEQGFVTVTRNDCSLTWAPEGARKVKGTRLEGEIRYPGILEGVDACYRVKGESIKENLILSDENCPGEITCLYQGKKLSALSMGDVISFVDETQEEVFVLTAPYMKDQAGAVSENITLSMEEGKKKGQYRITFHMDEAWLGAPERQYPVVLDPVITTSKKATEIQDAHVDSQNYGTNYRQSFFLKTMGGDNIQRSYMKFELPTIKTGDMIVNARLVMVSLAEDGKERTIEVHRVMQDWDSSNITWNNRPVYAETIEDLCKYKGDAQKYITMDITRLVKDWYENGKNYGLMIRDNYELSGYTEFLASDCPDDYQNMRPRVDISYVNYSGLEDYWTYHGQSVGRAGTGHVNDYNGNLVFVHSTMASV